VAAGGSRWRDQLALVSHLCSSSTPRSLRRGDGQATGRCEGQDRGWLPGAVSRGTTSLPVANLLAVLCIARLGRCGGWAQARVRARAWSGDRRRRRAHRTHTPRSLARHGHANLGLWAAPLGETQTPPSQCFLGEAVYRRRRHGGWWAVYRRKSHEKVWNRRHFSSKKDGKHSSPFPWSKVFVTITCTQRLVGGWRPRPQTQRNTVASTRARATLSAAPLARARPTARDPPMSSTSTPFALSSVFVTIT
jgi:hypothetical protein